MRRRRRFERPGFPLRKGRAKLVPIWTVGRRRSGGGKTLEGGLEMNDKKSRTRLPEAEVVAGNGLLDRRALLGRGILIAGAAATGVGGAASAAAEPLKDDPWTA